MLLLRISTAAALLAIALSPCAVFAQENTSENTSAPEVTATSATIAASNPIADKLQSAYRSAGATPEQIAKLRKLDDLIPHARRDGQEQMRQWAQERSRILTPEQMTQVRQYLRQSVLANATSPASGSGEVTAGSAETNSGSEATSSSRIETTGTATLTTATKSEAEKD